MRDGAFNSKEGQWRPMKTQRLGLCFLEKHRVKILILSLSILPSLPLFPLPHKCLCMCALWCQSLSCVLFEQCVFVH